MVLRIQQTDGKVNEICAQSWSWSYHTLLKLPLQYRLLIESLLRPFESLHNSTFVSLLMKIMKDAANQRLNLSLLIYFFGLSHFNMIFLSKIVFWLYLKNIFNKKKCNKKLNYIIFKFFILISNYYHCQRVCTILYIGSLVFFNENIFLENNYSII